MITVASDFDSFENLLSSRFAFVPVSTPFLSPKAESLASTALDALSHKILYESQLKLSWSHAANLTSLSSRARRRTDIHMSSNASYLIYATYLTFATYK